jgi:hypothetical protein
MAETLLAEGNNIYFSRFQQTEHIELRSLPEVFSMLCGNF